MIPRFGDGRDWWFEARFGLFVHWGIYAIPAWHEQHQWRGSVPRAEYARFAEQFNPIAFDPDSWLDLAEQVGMRYVCFTTKHHDGYCLWDTAQTEYKVTNSPYGRDVLRMLADACHRRNVPLCLYHSVADWHHPSYPNQGRSHELAGPEPGDVPDWERYRAYLLAQVQELCPQYGKIHGFWWDMNVTGIVDPSINEMIRSLQPNAVINNRGFDEGDFGTPERDYDRGQGGARGYERRVEACQSVGRESWGYRADEDYYADRHLIASIDRAMARGGNYLLNVGPKADGTIPHEAVRILSTVGDWYNCVNESFLGAEPALQGVENREVLLTRKGNALYVHMPDIPTMRRALLKPIFVAPSRATLLNTGEDVAFSLTDLPTEHMGDGGILIPEKHHYLRLCELPVNELGNEVLVIKLDFEEWPL